MIIFEEDHELIFISLSIRMIGSQSFTEKLKEAYKKLKDVRDDFEVRLL